MLAAILTSCTKPPADDDILDISSKYANDEKTDYSEFYESVEDLFTREEKYRPPDASDIADRGSDRLYFITKVDNGASTLNYMSLSTGNVHSICPDPLCTHLMDSGCKYLNLASYIADPASPSVVYVKKIDEMQIAICRIDTENDTIEEIYVANRTPDVTESVLFKFISNNKLYFTSIKTEKVTLEDGTVAREQTESFKILDLLTDEVSEVDYEHAIDARIASEKHIFYVDSQAGRLYATDLNFENETIVLEYDPSFSLGSMQYDKSTSKLYCDLTSNYIRGLKGYESAPEEGFIYEIDESLTAKKLEMPSNKILDFDLTSDYIYYTSYDPVNYGMSPRGTDCICGSGNKIYRVERGDTTSEPELIFDGKDAIFKGDSGNYFVYGNYLYMTYYTLVESGGMSFFRYMGIYARIDFENNTIKFLTLN